MKHKANKLKNSVILASGSGVTQDTLKDISENHVTDHPTKYRTHTPQPQVCKSQQLMNYTNDLIFESP